MSPEASKNGQKWPKMGTDNQALAKLSLFLAKLSPFFGGYIISLRPESYFIIITNSKNKYYES
jgi:hypothetical protein